MVHVVLSIPHLCVWLMGSAQKNSLNSSKENTVYSVNGYPHYRRRDNDRAVNVRRVDLNNPWIVPCNLYLSSKYNAYINLEALYYCACS